MDFPVQAMWYLVVGFIIKRSIVSLEYFLLRDEYLDTGNAGYLLRLFHHFP